jgi:tetratricopeptide (TPR) repeat protein
MTLSPGRVAAWGIASVLIAAGLPAVAVADIRTVTATGEYRMGDNDTRTDAKRLALLEAKRLALEQVGTYLEGVTEVKNFGLSRDEIRAYTAGIVEVTEQAARTTMEGETTVIRVDVRCKIDTAILARQIEALRQNESARNELEEAKQEADRLRQELDGKTRELAALKSKTEAQTVLQQREQVLNQMEAKDLLVRASVLAGSDETSYLAGSSQDRRPGPLLLPGAVPPGKLPERPLLEQALALDPSNVTAHRKLGLLLLRSHDLLGAEREFRTAVRLKPNDARSHLGLAVSLRAMGRREDAAREFAEYQRLAPNTPTERQFLERVKRNFQDSLRPHPPRPIPPRFPNRDQRRLREPDR